MRDMWNYGYGYDLGFPFFPLLWLLFWVFVIFMVFGRKRRWDRHFHDSSKEMTAEEVLADRFARGEIDEKEYEKRVEVLKKHNKKE